MRLINKLILTVRSKKGFKYYSEDKYLVKKVLELSKVECAKTLDVGCGIGHYSFLFDKEGANVTGFDIDKTLIEKANGKKKKINSDALFLVCDGRFPEKYFNEKFDIIFMSGFSIFGSQLNKKIMEKYISLLDSEGKLVFVHSSNLTGIIRDTGWRNHKIGELKVFFESCDCNIKEVYFYNRHVVLKILHSFVFNSYSTRMHLLITKMTKLRCSLVFIVEKNN